MSDLRPESILSACTSQTTDGSERVFGQMPRLSRPSIGDREASIGAISTSSSSQFPHKRLQEVGHESTTAIQCTSPRNSSAGSPSHTQSHSNIVVFAQGNRRAVDLSRTESTASDTVSTLHSSPVEATPDNGHPGYLAAPQHYLGSGANPLPDDVRSTHQRREGRANEHDFVQLIENTRANGEPNNDVAQAEQQRWN